jgi:hypothetical protein
MPASFTDHQAGAEQERIMVIRSDGCVPFVQASTDPFPLDRLHSGQGTLKPTLSRPHLTSTRRHGKV